MCRGDPSRQRPVDGRVVVPHLDAYLGRHRLGALIDALVDRRVGVRVDQPGHEVFVGPVDHPNATGNFDVAADRGDRAVLYDHRAVLDDRSGDGDDRDVTNRDVLCHRGSCHRGGRRRSKDANGG